MLSELHFSFSSWVWLCLGTMVRRKAWFWLNIAKVKTIFSCLHTWQNIFTLECLTKTKYFLDHRTVSSLTFLGLSLTTFENHQQYEFRPTSGLSDFPGLQRRERSFHTHKQAQHHGCFRGKTSRKYAPNCFIIESHPSLWLQALGSAFDFGRSEWL